MKYLAIATALLLSGTAVAQTSTSGTAEPASQTAPAPNSTADGMQDDMMQETSPPMTQDNAVPPAPPAPGAPPAPPAPPAPGQPMPGQTMPMNQTMAAGGEDPVGGYMPSQPALSGPATAGATIQFQASQPASQAFPAPAPMAEYPVCKSGQYDNCRQRGE